MLIEDVFASQTSTEPAPSDGDRAVSGMLCLDTGTSRLVIALEQAREVVEEPSIVAYPFPAGRHVGIVNVRGTIVPVVSFDGDGDASWLVVVGVEGQSPFAIVAREVRPVDIADLSVAEACRLDSAEAGVVSVSGRPTHWASITWLRELFFGDAS